MGLKNRPSTSFFPFDVAGNVFTAFLSAAGGPPATPLSPLRWSVTQSLPGKTPPWEVERCLKFPLPTALGGGRTFRGRHFLLNIVFFKKTIYF